MVIADRTKPSALLIGADRYRSLRELKGAEGDARDMRTWLTEAGGVPKKNITCLLSSDNAKDGNDRDYVPMTEQVHAWLDALDKLAAKHPDVEFPLGPRVYVLYAGHGYNHSAMQQTAMFPKTHKDSWDLLPLAPMVTYLKLKAHFREIVLVSDACRGLLDYAPMPSWMRTPEPSPHAHKVRMFEAYAAGAGEVTKEIEFRPGEFRGVLTQAFIRGLRGAGREPNGNVTNAKLKDYVKNAVIAKLGERGKPDVRDPDDMVLCTAPEVTCRLKITPRQETAGSATIRRHIDNMTQEVPLDQGELKFEIPIGRYTIVTPGGREQQLVAVWEEEHVVV